MAYPLMLPNVSRLYKLRQATGIVPASKGTDDQAPTAERPASHHLVGPVKGLFGGEAHNALLGAVGDGAGEAGSMGRLREGRKLLPSRLGSPYKGPSRIKHTSLHAGCAIV